MANDKEPAWTKIEFDQCVEKLVQFGPTMPVKVSASPYAGGEIAQVLAQIDTGAAGTAISARLAKRLALPVIDTGEAHVAGLPPVHAPYHTVKIVFPSGEIDLDVVSIAALDPPHDVLICRDILANCRLCVDFLSGVTLLHMRAS